MTKRLPEPERERAFQRRLKRWRHYGFLGSVSMAKQNMLGIMESPTSTDESKELAYEICILLLRLARSLKSRKDTQ